MEWLVIFSFPAELFKLRIVGSRNIIQRRIQNDGPIAIRWITGTV
jgi:hypothetical protein